MKKINWKYVDQRIPARARFGNIIMVCYRYITLTGKPRYWAYVSMGKLGNLFGPHRHTFTRAKKDVPEMVSDFLLTKRDVILAEIDKLGLDD